MRGPDGPKARASATATASRQAPVRSDRADAHEIVEMHDPNHLPTLDDEKRRDLAADVFQRFGDERVGADRAGVPVITLATGVSSENSPGDGGEGRRR